MPQVKRTRRSRPLWVMVSIILVFVLPFIFAKYLLNENMIGESLSYGHLITPSFDITKFALFNKDNQPLNNALLQAYQSPNATRTTGKWLLLYVHPSACNKRCQKEFTALRQLQKAQGKNQKRLRRGMLSFNAGIHRALHSAYPKAYFLHTSRKDFLRILEKATHLNAAKLINITLLVDPNGNVMMRYPQNPDFSKMFKDVKRLLKVSQIG